MKKLLILSCILFLQVAQSEPVEDNSFLVEEAYNQEPGVVQFINVYQKAKTGKNWAYVFINEIPVISQDHQFSYEIPSIYSEILDKTSLGDVKLNYRYEFIRNDIFVTTGRMSLSLATGDHKEGFGTGSIGYETSLLASIKLNKNWIQHWNIGAAITPSAKDTLGNTADNSKYFWNLSNIYLVTDNLNFMLETTTSTFEETAGNNLTDWSTETIISPSVRYAIDIADWQYVPGLAFPTSIGKDAGSSNQTLVYLSIEGKMW